MEPVSVLDRPPFTPAGARYGSGLVTAILAGEAVPDPEETGAMAPTAATFLAHVLFLTRIAAGDDPHQSAALLAGNDRGTELARRFLGAGTVQVCCDYCEGMMTGALARAAAVQMIGLHGEAIAVAAWAQLERAILPPPPEPPVLP